MIASLPGLVQTIYKVTTVKQSVVYAKQLGKIIIPFGVYNEIEKNLTGELEFLHHHYIINPESTSFFEVLRHIDETLFEFEKIAIPLPV